MNPRQCTVTVTKKVFLTKTVVLFSFGLTEGSLTFTAGQYGAFVIDEKTRRQYSFCSTPNNSSSFDIAIDTAPMGPGSKYFLSKNIGDTMSCVAPLGVFVLDKTTHRKKIVVATGTGVAPFRSMILDYLEGRPPASAYGAAVGGRGTDDITLYWGMRHEEDLYWVDDFLEISHTYPNFRFVLTLSQSHETWKGTRGRVTDHVVQDEHNLSGSDYYICGNRMMISDMEKQLREQNVPVAQIHKEMYF